MVLVLGRTQRLLLTIEYARFDERYIVLQNAA
jgi:hypothetical protein